jgi:hypothetical protein
MENTVNTILTKLRWVDPTTTYSVYQKSSEVKITKKKKKKTYLLPKKENNEFLQSFLDKRVMEIY